MSSQEPRPEQAPDQPPNALPTAGCASSTMPVPSTNVPSQVLPQAIPAGLLVTVPLPVPVLLTLS
ncbi:hypothetical protein CKO42_09190 [Lamprobacter modestohalophilus]|uniref:Uncharacterized protein n=1 Tax=Lamprobacter modestohalophilus TaxID=1064514 RepID=A0A9X0W832_9GAMM|nr:hypothetical protein [Lamprobacter modestohalophilus]